MARTDDDLKKLYRDFKGWFESEFGKPFSPKEFKPAIRLLSRAKLLDFAKRRVGHLPDIDFFGFVMLLNEDAAKKAEPVIAKVDAPKSEEAKARTPKRK